MGNVMPNKRRLTKRHKKAVKTVNVIIAQLTEIVNVRESIPQKERQFLCEQVAIFNSFLPVINTPKGCKKVKEFEENVLPIINIMLKQAQERVNNADKVEDAIGQAEDGNDVDNSSKDELLIVLKETEMIVEESIAHIPEVNGSDDSSNDVDDFIEPTSI